MSSSAEQRFTAESLRSQTTAILQAWGTPQEQARTTARLMVETDLLGVESHGVSMLPQYEAMHASGRLRLAAVPRLLRDGPATALLDGGAGLGHAVSAQAMQLAVDKARKSGIALVGVRNSHHFGAAGVYARIAQRQGLIVNGGAFARDLDAIIDVLHATRPTAPAQPVLVPGDPEAAQQAERESLGIPLPAPLVAQIRDIAARAGARYLLAAPEGAAA